MKYSDPEQKYPPCNGKPLLLLQQRRQRGQHQVERSCCYISGIVKVYKLYNNIMTDYLQNGQTNTRNYYSGLLVKLQSEMVRKSYGKFSNGVFPLFHCMTMPLPTMYNKQCSIDNTKVWLSNPAQPS